MSADIDNIRAEFEAKFPRAVWDMQAQGYTEEMYTYALVGYRAARATPLAPTPAAAEGQAKAVAWIHDTGHTRQLSFSPDVYGFPPTSTGNPVTPLYAAPLPRQAAVQGDLIAHIVDRDTPPDNRNEIIDHDIRGNPITRGDVATMATAGKEAK